ncbi:hypothetical protein Q8F55_004532 [Vanrija albida]|uniref:Major facilitator superfamily (MFS) profile domain-containing protein n=1 Tax=Vanrija albida TaxID=181172 RepID=A0ABR3Q715_9TREE
MAPVAIMTPGQGQPQEAGWKLLVSNRRCLGLATFSALGGVLYGYNQGVFSNVQVQAEFHHRFQRTLENSATKGMLTAILELGAFLSSLMAGPISDRISRKHSITLWTVIFIAGVIVQTAATYNVGMIYAGRWFAGMGVGGLSTVVPMYNAELAPAAIRGTLVGLQQVAICFGIMISYWIAYGTAFIGGTTYPGQSSAAWRVPLGIQILPALVLAIGIRFLPFSPRWLMLHDREDECLAVIANLRAKPASDPDVQYEFACLRAERLIQKDIAERRYGVSQITWREEMREYWRLVSTPGLRKRATFGPLVQAFGQFSGINAILYYAPTIFDQLGLTGGTTSLLATGIIGVVLFLVTIPGALFADSVGRRPLLIFASASMAISHAIIAALVARFGSNFATHKGAGYAAVVFVFWYTASYGFGFGPVGWIVAAESCPLDQRARSVGLASAVNWITNFTVAQITPIMLTDIGYKTFIVFMVFCVLCLAWVIIFLPELKGLSLEEIDALFDDKSSEEERERRDEIARSVGLGVAQVDSNEPKHLSDVYYDKTGNKV